MIAAETRGVLWGGYFIALLGLWVLGLIFGAKDPVSMASAIVNGVCLVGLWGYTSQRAIGNAAIWATMLALQVVASIVVGALLIADGVPLAAVAAVTVVVVPLLVALYRYAFHSRALWAATEA